MSKPDRKRLNRQVKDYGLKVGQIWEDKKGGILESIKPPVTLDGLGLWHCHFRLVNTGDDN